jgi:hypothetical protein
MINKTRKKEAPFWDCDITCATRLTNNSLPAAHYRIETTTDDLRSNCTENTLDQTLIIRHASLRLENTLPEQWVVVGRCRENTLDQGVFASKTLIIMAQRTCLLAAEARLTVFVSRGKLYMHKTKPSITNNQARWPVERYTVSWHVPYAWPCALLINNLDDNTSTINFELHSCGFFHYLHMYMQIITIST